MRKSPPVLPTAPGFTLPAVMIVAAAMLILAVGLLVIIGIERKTARSFSDAKRAELAARAGLEDFRAILRAETANDDFLVISGKPDIEPELDLEIAQNLFIARGSGGGDSVSYRYLPLFSTTELPENSSTLTAPEIEARDSESGDQDDRFTTIDGPPWLQAPSVQWIPINDEDGEIVARYAYWVEDLQAKVDAKTAGNIDGVSGAHERNAYPFPAPGINPEPLSEDELKLDRVAIHVLDPDASEEGDGTLFNRISAGRPVMLSPDSIVAAAGYEDPILRDEETGLLDEPIAAALEKSASPVVQHYKERPTVPFAEGISEDVAGEPKLNLNKLLDDSRSSAVSEFASWIDKALPDFEDRKGGFPDNYLETLAANAFDYADSDNDSTFKEGSYRGLDGFPLVSEFLMSFRWDDVVREDGRLYVIMEVGTYVELWNMTNVPIEGEAQVSFETKFDFPVGANPEISFEEESTDSEVASPVTTEENGYYWHAPFAVALEPDEYHVYPMVIRFKIDAGSASGFAESPIQFKGNQADGESGYRLRWNGEMIDQSRSNTWKTGATVYYPERLPNSPGRVTRATIPAHSHSTQPANLGPFENNMGDPRMAMYLGTHQASNAYPGNYSPNRRTIRWGSVYSNDSSEKRTHYGRVLPAEWPDGGHNSPYGSNSFYTSNDQIVPDDPRFYKGRPTPKMEQSPMRLSNLGRFYSATELGRVYDPVMWSPTYGDLEGSSGSGARDTATFTAQRGARLPDGRVSWPEVEISSIATQSYGGGNTLRIGRYEHPRFERPGLHAAHLLDLFHAGESTSENASLREGNLVDIAGNVNLNTAEADAIRALAAGMLQQDPLLSQTTSRSHQTSSLMSLPTFRLELGTPTETKVADRVAEAIINSRPFATAADIASARDEDDDSPFGNRAMYKENERIEWTDSAAEEVFARMYEASTLRSRNFRIWVVGQALAAPPSGSTAKPKVLSESKKVFTVFADPGERNSEDEIEPTTYRPRVIHENDF